MAFTSINPFTEKLVFSVPFISDDKLNHKLVEAGKAWERWKNIDLKIRAELLYECAEVLEKNKEEYARWMAAEMGKAIKEGIAEIEKCAATCRYYADHSSDFLANKKLEVPDGEAFVQFESLGVILAIMPWNFPFWQVFRFLAPNLMLGNAAVLKHASNVGKCAQLIEDTLIKAGFPSNVFQNLYIDISQVEQVIAHESIRGISLTGSERAGSSVAALAGKYLKKTVLELGGSDAFVVLDNTYLDNTVKMAVKSRMVNSGQSCIAAKRFIINSSVFDLFLELLIKELDQITIGDPLLDSTHYGPMVSEKQAKELENQVNKSVELGAHLVYGKPRQGAIYHPQVIKNITKGMPAYDQELFGPVFTLFKVDSDEEAIRLANDSCYGLGGSVWGESQRANIVADAIQAGAVYVNRMMASYAAIPFGGIKNSGYGRELSYFGQREFANIKSIWRA